MGKRRLGALIGAAVLTFAAVGAVSAGGPTYTIDVTKSANPTTVPVSGGTVDFTVTVHNTGTGDFATVQVADDMAGCTLSGPSGDAGTVGTLDNGETWTYTCSVDGVMPGDTNTATVDACHNSSPNCKQDAQKVEQTGQVTLGTCESDCPTAQPPTPEPTNGGGTATNVPSQAPTDTTITGSSGPSDSAWLLVIGLGLLLGSLVVLRPARSAKDRS